MLKEIAYLALAYLIYSNWDLIVSVWNSANASYNLLEKLKGLFN